MDPDTFRIVVIALVIVGMVGSLSGIVVRVTRALRRDTRPRELPNMVYEQRFDQLQQSVDAIAVEVERIAEAQRFSARLLAERSDTPALPR